MSLFFRAPSRLWTPPFYMHGPRVGVQISLLYLPRCVVFPFAHRAGADMLDQEKLSTSPLVADPCSADGRRWPLRHVFHRRRFWHMSENALPLHATSFGEPGSQRCGFQVAKFFEDPHRMRGVRHHRLRSRRGSLRVHIGVTAGKSRKSTWTNSASVRAPSKPCNDRCSCAPAQGGLALRRSLNRAFR